MHTRAFACEIPFQTSMAGLFSIHRRVGASDCEAVARGYPWSHQAEMLTGFWLEQSWRGRAQQAQAGGEIKNRRERCLIGHPKAGSDATEMERALIKEVDEQREGIDGRQSQTTANLQSGCCSVGFILIQNVFPCLERE